MAPTPTSQAAPQPTLQPPVTLQVRPKGGWLTARPVDQKTEGTIVRRPDQSLVSAKLGDYLIASGAVLIDVVSRQDLEKQYEIQTTGLRLSEDATRKIAAMLGPASTASPQALADAVARVTRIKVSGVEIQFTPGQMEELHHRAMKNSRTVEQEMQWIIHRIEDELFHGGVARSAAGRV